MLEKLKLLICHPKMIGMYYKDTVFKILLTIMIFVLTYIGIVAVSAYNRTYFTTQTGNDIVNMIVHDDERNISYNKTTGLLTGLDCTYISDSYEVYFLPAIVPSTVSVNKTILIFGPDTLSVYSSLFKISQRKYLSLSDVNDFSFSEIKKGNLNQSMSFESIVTQTLLDGNANYGSIVFFENVFQTLVMYLIIVFITFFTSKFYKPEIDNRSRIKLAFYSCLIFFIGEIFAVLFSAEWIVYAALILPIIYSTITFSHIVRRK